MRSEKLHLENDSISTDSCSMSKIWAMKWIWKYIIHKSIVYAMKTVALVEMSSVSLDLGTS
jgi:hypothetical protein